MTHPYATLEYARSLRHMGEALYVSEWDAAVLVRPISDSWLDAAGCYPLAVLARDADLEAGLERLLKEHLVSVVLVVDDFFRPPLDGLAAAFDFVRPLKTHYVLDQRKGPVRYSRNHRYKINRALKTVRIETFDLSDRLEDWRALYGSLTKRHDLTGTHDFPDSYHAALAETGGVTAVGAFIDDALVSCHIWVRHERHAHSHLVASSPEGYAARAAYAVNDASIRHFADCDTINFGGGAGVADDPEDGLARFKKGFSNTTAPSYLCGKVLDPAAYDRLSADAGAASGTAFFPRYRAPHGR